MSNPEARGFRWNEAGRYWEVAEGVAAIRTGGIKPGKAPVVCCAYECRSPETYATGVLRGAIDRIELCRHHAEAFDADGLFVEGSVRRVSR